MRREGTPAWMQVVDGACLPQTGREQAVEEARSHPDLPAAGRRGSTPSTACSRRGSTTYIPEGVQP